MAEDQLYTSRWNWFWRPCLLAASQFYAIGLYFHRFLYEKSFLKRHRFSVPVISVGNMTWGGTGKTPMVEHLARYIISVHKTPLILTRGYGKDESKELAQKLPSARLGFGKDRVQTGEAALRKEKADIILLDDGFQHWPVKRDLEIVVINTLNPFGNGHLIPRGILREPVPSLSRAPIIVLNDVNLVARRELDALRQRVRQISPHAFFIEAYHEPLYFFKPRSRQRLHIDRLQGVKVTTFSGIGMPRSFQMLLNRLGIKCVRNFEFSDHHAFSQRDLKEIVEMKEKSESDEIITTEKDYYRSETKIREILDPLVLKVRLHVSSGEPQLREMVCRLMGITPKSVWQGDRSQDSSETDGPNRRFVTDRRAGNG